jgi:hypothetical protein
MAWTSPGMTGKELVNLLLVHWTAEGAAKPLRFAPRLTNTGAKTSELGRYMDDDECDHGYCPALTIKRLI